MLRLKYKIELSVLFGLYLGHPVMGQQFLEPSISIMDKLQIINAC